MYYVYIYISHARKRLNYFSVYQKLTQQYKQIILQFKKGGRRDITLPGGLCKEVTVKLKFAVIS